jgi:uncharacterized protein YjbI with pentapeptide repeats
MDHHLSPKPLRVFLEDDAGEKEVDLAKVAPTEFFKNDLIRYRITGTIPREPDFSIVNFVGCVLHDITAEGVDFSECDFKDTFVKGAAFSECIFNGGTFATTFFSDSEFRGCTFYNNAAYSCDFRQVHFIDCDLTNLLVKSSRFSQCSFQNCITSNKICEMSTLFDVTFTNTPIQLETITNNFGLTSSDLRDSEIRSGRARESYHPLQVDDLKDLLNSRDLSALERLTLQYFLDHTLLDGSVLLDESLDITRWTRMYRNPGSFVELLDKFAEFLVHLYDDNRLAVHPIILLHHITGTLINSIPLEENLHRVAMSLGGIHLILSRIVEEYLHVLDLTSQYTGGTVLFRVNGPLDPNYYRTELTPWIGDKDVVITRLEQNSPLVLELTANDLISLLPLLAVFLATRTKVEITKLKSSLEKAAKSNRTKAEKRGSKTSISKKDLPALPQQIQAPIFSVRAGLVKSPNPAYELQVKTRMPGSLLVDLRLAFSTTLIHRLRGILITLLIGSKDKRS